MKSTEEQLEKLFGKWKLRHRKEKNKSAKKTCQNVSYKNKFAYDGLIGKDNEWEKVKSKVLYIALAPNYINGKNQRNCFWIQDVVYQSTVPEQGEKFVDVFLEKQKELVGDSINSDVSIGIYNELRYAAFMNLSKRGYCYSKKPIDWSYLEKYIQRYKKELQKEIKILNPDIIVCYGEFTKRKVKVLLSGMGKPFSDMKIQVIPSLYERNKQ